MDAHFLKGKFSFKKDAVGLKATFRLGHRLSTASEKPWGLFRSVLQELWPDLFSTSRVSCFRLITQGSVLFHKNISEASIPVPQQQTRNRKCFGFSKIGCGSFPKRSCFCGGLAAMLSWRVCVLDLFLAELDWSR